MKPYNLQTGITMRKRIVFLLLFILILQFVIIGRYAYVQIIWSPKLQKLAQNQWTQDISIPAKRGMILDRNGTPLAISGNVEKVDVYLKDLTNAVKNKKITVDDMAEKLSSVLGIQKATVLSKLNTKLSNGKPPASVSIARMIEKDKTNKLRELKLPGVIITSDTKRYYPNGNFLSQVLGNVNVDGDGRAGLEYQYNNELKGIAGRLIGEIGANSKQMPNSIPKNYIAPKDGNDIVLTIDQSIEHFVEKALEKGLSDYKAKRISCIVMDVKTGEVLAMANKPDYDPNEPIKGSVADSMALWKNRTVNENFEPGSIQKVITTSAAVQENVVGPNDRFQCNGSMKVAGSTIHCWKTGGHGTETFAQILQNSCNVGFMQLGLKMGKEKLYKYFDLFGLGKKTNIDYPGEEKGIVTPINKVGEVELANEAFGQGIALTEIQYMAALSAVGNNGTLLQPHLVKQIVTRDDSGNIVNTKDIKPKVVRQVISKESSVKVREMLESVVTEGVAKKAYIAGYHIGGKTGTAEKARPNGGGYEQGKYVSSFVALAPCTDPRIAIIVSLDEPDPSNYYSGSTAAPLAKDILEDIFNYLNMKPDSTSSSENVPNVVVPEIRGKSLNEAESILTKNKLGFDIQGNGSIINDISPKPGVSVKENTKVTIYMSNTNSIDKKISVPDFSNMTKNEIEDISNSLGVVPVFDSNGICTGQDIQAGTEVNKGTKVKVKMEMVND